MATRSKDGQKVTNLARERGEEALNRVLEIMRTSSDEKVVLQAANMVLDRGFGKATTVVDVSSKHEEEHKITFQPGALSLDNIRDIINARNAGQFEVIDAIEVEAIEYHADKNESKPDTK